MNAAERRFLWQPILDLPEDWSDWRSSELANLAAIWAGQSARLATSAAIKDFHQRMSREWAIETGIIEGLYTLDRGTTQLLIEKGIEASLIAHDASSQPPELIAQIISVQQETLEGIFTFVSQKRPLSKSYIKQLHQVMTRFQETVDGIDHLGNYVRAPLIRGDWKKLPNNPMRPEAFIHEYCPPEHVESEMDRLIGWHERHVTENVPPEIEAAWLHHRFTQIHPFQDGNGRIARAIASLILLRGRCFPLTIHRDDREEYINALEVADRSDLSPLVALFVRIQKSAFLKALSVSETVIRDYVPVKDVISAAVGRLQDRNLSAAEVQSRVFQTGDMLVAKTSEHLRAIANQLTAALLTVNSSYRSHVDLSNAQNDIWFKRQIVETAQRLGYYADTRTYRAWVRLKIREDRQAELVISFHAIGTAFVGVLAVSAFIEYRDRNEDGAVTLDGPHPVCHEPFEFSYLDDPATVDERFRKWLNDATLLGLDQWRRQL